MLNKMEVRDLPDKVFKVMAIKLLTQVRRTMHNQSENFNKDIKIARKHTYKIKQ